MNKHQKLKENIPAYTLGVLAEDEAKQLESHLTSCQECQHVLARYEQTTGQLSNTLRQKEPPAHLKEQLMERIRPSQAAREIQADEKSFINRLWRSVRTPSPTWATASAILILLLVVANVVLWRQSSLPSTPAINTVALAGTGNAPEADGVMVVPQGEMEGVLIVHDLSPLPEDQQYQLWLIDDNGNRDSGAVFSVGQRGQAEVKVTGRKPLVEYADFGITIEPFGGSPNPTGQKVLGREA